MAANFQNRVVSSLIVLHPCGNLGCFCAALNASAEESERRDEQEQVVLSKPLEVGQLRRGVDELRKNIAEWYGHFRA